MSSLSIREFFLNENFVEPFGLYSLGHWISLVIVFFLLFIIYKNRDKLRNLSPNKKEKINKIMVITLFINMKLLYLPLLWYGEWSWKTHLPFHMCFIAGYLFMYSVWFKNEKTYKIAYFLGFIGPLPAILLPDLRGYYEAFVFYHFIISHHVFMIFNMIYLYMSNIKITFDNLKKSFLVASSIFFIMYIFNMTFGTNYIFSNAIPEHVLNFMPFLRSINYPVLLLVITGSVVLFIAYIPVYLESKKLKKLNNS